jgi:hypothetical protein
MPNIKIANTLKVNGVNFSRLILDYKYPVGCFYVQYPESNTNVINTGDILKTPFPEDKTPAKLFGGVWKDMWTDESVYFRTGTAGIAGADINPAFETIQICATDISDNATCDIKKTIDSRVDGFQDYALRDISGWTSWAQGNMENTTCEWYDIKCNNLVTPAKCTELSGVFTKCEQTLIGADSGSGDDIGHQNIFNSSWYFQSMYPTDYEKYTSKDEVRVKNRLIKVWKRIE